MAKVKITGHASGTGILTVTAPNTSTDRTITLPDSTGTLATTADAFDPDGAVVFNDSHADVDFRVESDVNTHQLFVDGGNDIVMIDQVANPGTVFRSSEPPHLQIKGNDAPSSSISISRHSANASPPGILFYKSRNTSVGSHTIVADNDSLGQIEWIVDDGTDDACKAGQISMKVDGSPAVNNTPAEMIFSTTPAGAADFTARLTLTSDGRGVSQFTAKAWARFTASEFSDSHNMSSFTDNGTGDYSFAIDVDLANGAYAVGSMGHSYSHISYKAAPSASVLRVGHYNNSGSQEDGDWMSVVIFGD